MVQLHDLLLDGALGDQPVDGNGAGLADAVGAVRRLVLHRRVPPRIEVNHVICGREIQALPAGPEADQE